MSEYMKTFVVSGAHDSLFTPEVVLSQLIPTFAFELPKEKIIWHHGPIMTPSTDGTTLQQPHMPLKVSVI